MISMMFRVMGADGHRQRVSFRSSFVFFQRVISEDGFTSMYLIECRCSDITHSNDYVDLIITACSEAACVSNLRSQLSDGIFENSRFGEVYLVADYCTSCSGLLNYGCNYDYYDSSNSTHSMISFNWDLASSNGGIYE